MGTEMWVTNNETNRCYHIHVKLNNPLMGTEIVSALLPFLVTNTLC